MPTFFVLLCFVVVIHWLIFSYPTGLLHWHCGNLTIAPVPAKQPWWIWINTSCEFIMNDCITTPKQSTTKPCAYFLGYTVTENCFCWSSWQYISIGMASHGVTKGPSANVARKTKQVQIDTPNLNYVCMILDDFGYFIESTFRIITCWNFQWVIMHQSYAFLALCEGNPVATYSGSPHKGLVMWRVFYIMKSYWKC